MKQEITCPRAAAYSADYSFGCPVAPLPGAAVEAPEKHNQRLGQSSQESAICDHCTRGYESQTAYNSLMVRMPENGANFVADSDVGVIQVRPNGYGTKEDLVADRVRELIVRGELAPGQRLRQDDIARRLDLSWTPVREAFRQLEVEGWIIIQPHRGAVVRSLSLKDFEDIYQLRLANEPQAARQGTLQLDADGLRTLEALAVEMDALNLAQSESWPRFLELERQFYGTQFAATGRPRLYNLVMSLRDASQRYLRLSFSIDDELAQHRLIYQETLEACRTRDGHSAEVARRRALKRVLRRVRPLLLRMLGTGATIPE